ncbi:hypothetical protein HN011_010082 [Eciton burchellii]|nr:hypothetical protein HN011_010082 [Eciton burchellii]
MWNAFKRGEAGAERRFRQPGTRCSRLHSSTKLTPQCCVCAKASGNIIELPNASVWPRAQFIFSIGDSTLRKEYSDTSPLTMTLIALGKSIFGILFSRHAFPHLLANAYELPSKGKMSSPVETFRCGGKITGSEGLRLLY